MRLGLWRLGLLHFAALAGAGLLPRPLAAEALSIDHEAPRCLVADKHPRLLACISPRAQAARARVYFRAGGTRDWYFVEMKPSGTCLEGVLPKPRRTLQHVDYYLSATDRSSEESRTGEHSPLVVPKEGDCREGLAPFVPNAPVVATPASAGAAALPAGFGVTGAGLSTGLVLGTVGGGAAVVGGIVAGGGEAGPTTTLAAGPSSTVAATPSTSATTTPTTTVPGAPTTTTLPAPTTTTTTLPGSPTTTTLPTTTTTTLPVTATTTLPTTTLPVTTTTTLPSTTTTTLPPTTTTTTLPPVTTTTTTLPTGCDQDNDDPPEVEMTAPSTGQLPGLSVEVRADAEDEDGIAEVRFYYQLLTTLPRVLIGSDSSAPYSRTWVFPSCALLLETTIRLTATAVDNCGEEETSQPVQVQLSNCLSMLEAPAQSSTGTSASELAVPGGRGQVIWNGVESMYPGMGVSALPTSGQRGLNRVEAILVQAHGRPGTWRFDLAGVQPGSLRVVAGDVALVGESAVVFRFRGRPGERAVFTFVRVVGHDASR
jgi:Bacterial Ig domain